MRPPPFRAWMANCLSLASASALACPLTPPAGLQGHTVSEELQINGLPTAIYEVRSIEPAERLAKQAELEWKSQGWMPQRHRQAPWLIVSAASGDCVSVLQLQEQAGTHGFLSVSRPQRATAALDEPTQRLMPPGSEIESVVRGKDSGRDGTTLVLRASQSSSQWAVALMHRLQGERWLNVSKHTFKRPDQQLEADRITAQAGNGRQFTAIVWGGGSTQAVITLTEPL